MMRFICAFLLLTLTFCGCAEGFDLSGMSLQELYNLRDQIDGRIREMESDVDGIIYDSGSYVIGRDMPAGDYVLIENEDAMFASVIVRENDSENSDLLIHHLISSQCVARLSEGMWVTLSEAKALPLSQARPVEVESIVDGGYLVGVTAPAGAFVVSPAENAPLSSYSIYDDILGTHAQLQKFEIIREPISIELNEGEYVEFSGCALSNE